MLCSHCGKCCEETEMELSREDVERLGGLDSVGSSPTFYSEVAGRREEAGKEEEKEG